MAEVKNLELTKDPLTNINIIFPMLNERSREALSHMMLGFYLNESIAKDGQKAEQSQEA